MEKRGVRFRTYNKLNILEILKPVNIEEYIWHLEHIEIHEINNKAKYWDIEQPFIENGFSLKSRLNKSEYYAIYAG